MSSQPVLYDRRGKVAVITLNRPDQMNALNRDMWQGLDLALSRYQADREAWAAVITGAGRAFCAGADLVDMSSSTSGTDAVAIPPRMYELALGGIWKPIIAAINGYALAAGWWIAQACDIRIAAQSAELGIPETRWNLRSDFVTDLTRIVGMGHALEIALWGDQRITAQRAYEIGFVNKVVPDERLFEEAINWAVRVTLLGPRSVSIMKHAIYSQWGTSTEIGSAFTRTAGQALAGMEDTVEGPSAFLERREPRFKNT
jgi:enoyl-CoA hydratase/carnithine racemase